MLVPLLQLNMLSAAVDSSSAPSGERVPDDAMIGLSIDQGANSIASAEAFGGVTQIDLTVDPLSIVSEESLGTSLDPGTIPELTLGAADESLTLTSSIGSGESFPDTHSIIGDANTTTYCVEAGQLSPSHPVEAAQVCY